MRKESKDRLLFGVLSGRELIYFFFGIIVVVVLLFYAWAFGLIRNDALLGKSEFANGRDVGMEMTEDSSGGYAISDTKVLLYDFRHHRKAPWRVYDTENDEITDGSGLARPLINSGLLPNSMTNGARLTGWNGNLVLVTKYSTNQEQLIFQWKTNGESVQGFKWKDFTNGSKILRDFNVIAVKDAWLYSMSFFGFKGVITATGNGTGLTTFANPFGTNLQFASSWPSQDALYVVGTATNKTSSAVFIFSLTNRALVYSNLSVKVPAQFDWMAARPNPASTHVIWIFGRRPKPMPNFWTKLPRFLQPPSGPNEEVDYYSSDLHATSFRKVASVTSPELFFWGVDGNSIWLPDEERGIKRYDLK